MASITAFPFWFGNLSRQEAEQKVSIPIPPGKTGVYLARTSSQSPSPEQGFAITVFYASTNQIGHLLVQYMDGGYGLSNCPEDQGIYPSLAALFSQSPLLSTLYAVPLNPTPVATGTYGAIQNVMRNSTELAVPVNPPQQSSFQSQPMMGGANRASINFQPPGMSPGMNRGSVNFQPPMMLSPPAQAGNRASMNFQPPPMVGQPPIMNRLSVQPQVNLSPPVAAQPRISLAPSSPPPATNSFQSQPLQTFTQTPNQFKSNSPPPQQSALAAMVTTPNQFQQKPAPSTAKASSPAPRSSQASSGGRIKVPFWHRKFL